MQNHSYCELLVESSEEVLIRNTVRNLILEYERFLTPKESFILRSFMENGNGNGWHSGKALKVLMKLRRFLEAEGIDKEVLAYISK